MIDLTDETVFAKVVIAGGGLWVAFAAAARRTALATQVTVIEAQWLAVAGVVMSALGACYLWRWGSDDTRARLVLAVMLAVLIGLPMAAGYVLGGAV